MTETFLSDTYEVYEPKWVWDAAQKKHVVEWAVVGTASRRNWTRKGRFEKFDSAASRSNLPAPQIMRDIEPYKPVAADKHTGKRPIIGGRRQHREFLKRNGYVEVGNSGFERADTGPAPGEIARDIKRVLGE